jgi:hypothetical protein
LRRCKGLVKLAPMKIRTIIYKVLITITSVVSCYVGLGFLNFFILTPIIVGDPERYDTDGIKTGKLFDLFYEISSNTGYHPEPSVFNAYFTLCLGVIVGSYVAFRWSKSMRKG